MNLLYHGDERLIDEDLYSIFSAIKVASTETSDLEVGFTLGQMEQSLKVILRTTGKKDLEHSLLQVETRLRFVTIILSFLFP